MSPFSITPSSERKPWSGTSIGRLFSRNCKDGHNIGLPVLIMTRNLRRPCPWRVCLLTTDVDKARGRIELTFFAALQCAFAELWAEGLDTRNCSRSALDVRIGSFVNRFRWRPWPSGVRFESVSYFRISGIWGSLLWHVVQDIFASSEDWQPDFWLPLLLVGFAIFRLEVDDFYFCYNLCKFLVSANDQDRKCAWFSSFLSAYQ